MAQDTPGHVLATRLAAAGGRISRLLEDLRGMSAAVDSEVRRGPVNLGDIAKSVARQLRKSYPGRRVTLSVAKGLVAEGDERLLHIMLQSLLDNAWKFTAERPVGKVGVGATEQDGRTVYYVRDDGVGFDPAHADMLFGLFQRLHREEDFEGTGVGLAMARHIAQRHGGAMWAEGQPGQGATFYFSL